jgi:hypothetical protein
MHERDFETVRNIIETRGGFGHREHIELAWIYLGRYGVEDVFDVAGVALRHLAALHGEPDRYHETLTRAWVHLVAVHWTRSDAGSFEEFIDGNAALLDRGLLGHHFSRELMGSPTARATWVDPDLRALPALEV